MNGRRKERERYSHKVPAKKSSFHGHNHFFFTVPVFFPHATFFPEYPRSRSPSPPTQKKSTPGGERKSFTFFFFGCCTWYVCVASCQEGESKATERRRRRRKGTVALSLSLSLSGGGGCGGCGGGCGGRGASCALERS